MEGRREGGEEHRKQGAKEDGKEKGRKEDGIKGTQDRQEGRESGTWIARCEERSP